MIIQTSQIDMRSQHQLNQMETEQEQLQVWHNSENGATANQAVGMIELKTDKVSFSQQSLALEQQTSISQTRSNPEIADEINPEDDIEQGWKLKLLQRLVESLTGKKIKVVAASNSTTAEETVSASNQQPQQTGEPAAETSVGWGLHYSYQRSYHEDEQTSFAATGVVKTADGKQIDLSVTLNMSRSFSSHESIDLLAGDALKDPLVINFNGNAAQLEQTDLQFDIDLDGEADQLKFVSPGSGFLALDRNGDNTINDGSELFGPTSGDGFAELAEFDQDNNNWIDENDAIYDKLRIWSRNGSGDTQLVALGKQGVGAIYLGNIATPFSVNNSQNQQLGQIQSSGLFLSESGQAGTIQQLDLVV